MLRLPLILNIKQVDLPKKHGRGGQSAMRFARLRLEKRHNYVRKCAELAVQFFITNDKPNVQGLVLAGSADFKSELVKSDMFDGRLKAIVIKEVDVSYGGENGFNQAIELSKESLSNVKFVQEKELIQKFFDEIAQDTGKYCFGVKDTMQVRRDSDNIGEDTSYACLTCLPQALDLGAVETLIVWEDLEILRYELKNQSSGESKVLYLKPGEEKSTADFQDKETGVELDVSGE